MNKDWLYFVNPFITATNNSYRATVKIGDFTLNALKSHIAILVPPAPPSFAAATTTETEYDFFVNLRDTLQPFVNDYHDKYTAWSSQKGIQKGKTSKLADTLALLRSDMIESWDLAIQNVYRKDTPNYTSLLPHYRKPFQQGSQEERLNAVRTLKQNVTADTAMPTTLKESITEFLATFEADFNTSQQKKSGTTDTSHAVEQSRLALCECMYGVMAQLMDFYKKTPELGMQYFDLQTIRNHEQSTFKHKVKESATYLIMKHSFDADEHIRLINDGDTDLKFYLVEFENDNPGTKSITVEAHKEATALATDLGVATFKCLKVENLSDTTDGHYTVELY